MRVLVVGGAGFISGAAVRRLARDGHEVLCFHRGVTSAELPRGVARVLGDRRSIAEHAATLRAFQPDVVIDCVAYHEQDATTLLETFRDVEQFVVLSSMDVYRAWSRFTRVEPGPPDPVPLAEDAPLRSSRFPRRASVTPGDVMWDYDKILVEDALAGRACTILRLPMVYGPGDHKRRRVGNYLARMRSTDPIVLDPAVARWRCSRCYVDDVAEAIVLAAMTRDGRTRAYNVADAEALTERDWVLAISRAASWGGTVSEMPAVHDEDFSQDVVIDARRIRSDLGWHPRTSLEHGIAASVAWSLAAR